MPDLVKEIVGRLARKDSTAVVLFHHSRSRSAGSDLA